MQANIWVRLSLTQHFLRRQGVKAQRPASDELGHPSVDQLRDRLLQLLLQLWDDLGRYDPVSGEAAGSFSFLHLFAPPHDFFRFAQILLYYHNITKVSKRLHYLM